ncbi:MAG TPA: universal stress protein [Burkholderiales bacterium]|nr:universal stress protein [Burkholderiales bacterium]
MPAGAGGAVKVLVPLDGTPNSLTAVHHVIDRYLAHHDLEVHLLHVRQPFSELVARFTSRGSRESYHWEAAQQALAPARELLFRHRIPHAAHVELGDRAAVIERIAEMLGVSHIVMGTARRSSLTRLLEDSVTHRVLERAKVPVEVVVGPAVSRLERAGIPAAVAALIALAAVTVE